MECAAVVKLILVKVFSVVKYYYWASASPQPLESIFVFGLFPAVVRPGYYKAFVHRELTFKTKC